MSGLSGLLFIIGTLTVLGTGTLIVITLKYYWGERGIPPLNREERRKFRQEEINRRAKQIEYSQNHPIPTRNGNFWNNGKVYK